jgi:prepilin-type N-terminal cleavage/methylation domain-containing protein
MRRKGFSLVELLTALFIVSILVIAMATIYQSAVGAIGAIDEKLESGFGSTDIMHLIVDDISTVSSLDTDTSLTLQSKAVDGITVYRLEIISKIYDNAGKEIVYKKVIWQSDYDYLTGTISLYRCMGGMDVEDPILNTQARNNPDNDIFVPVVSGLTYFTMQVPQITATSQGEIENYLDSWEKDEMPGGIMVTLSFAPPVEYITGEVEVAEEDRVVRRISVNRSKEYKFKFVAKDLEEIYGEEDEDEMSEDDEEVVEEGEIVSEDGEVIEEIIEEDDGGDGNE